MYKPINMLELNDRDGYRNGLVKHQLRGQKKSVLKMSEKEQEERRGG